jgi:hypothetical protein
MKIPHGWEKCDKAEYESLPDTSRAFLWPEHGWRVGPLPRTTKDILSGKPSSIDFITIKRTKQNVES